MEDRLLAMMFEPPRWEKAIDIGVGKHINKTDLRELTKPEIRITIYKAIQNGTYAIVPPHAQLIPKDKPGEFRTVYINENIDRVVLSIINDLLFEVCADMIHPACKSYQKGIGCGKVVQECSRLIAEAKGKTIGWKSDLSKYFDSVPIEYIDKTFDEVERRVGRSKVIDMLRKYYHQDICIDVNGKVERKYMSLMQGCAVASFLADAVLYAVDEQMSKRKGGFYVRYSDDCLYIGKDYADALSNMERMLNEMGMKLNPKKVELLDANHWFKFLGFSIKGKDISLSKGRLKTFQKEIETRTIKAPLPPKGKDGKRPARTTPKKALNAVNRYMYKGDGMYSWATSVLPIINNEHDIEELNAFVMDCLRAVATGKSKVGGLGYESIRTIGVITRGTGRNVTANRHKTEKEIEGYRTISCMRNALLTSREAYETLVREL